LCADWYWCQQERLLHPQSCWGDAAVEEIQGAASLDPDLKAEAKVNCSGWEPFCPNLEHRAHSSPRPHSTLPSLRQSTPSIDPSLSTFNSFTLGKCWNYSRAELSTTLSVAIRRSANWFRCFGRRTGNTEFCIYVGLTSHHVEHLNQFIHATLIFPTARWLRNSYDITWSVRLYANEVKHPLATCEAKNNVSDINRKI